jgi:hypothetical protein
MAVRRGNEVEVHVRDGLVRVTLGSDSRQLARGESANLRATGGPIQTGRDAGADPAWHWADALAPRVPIEGRDLLTVLRTLAYQSGLELRFATPAMEAAAASTTLHGPTLNLAPRETMRALLTTSGLSMTEDASTSTSSATTFMRSDASPAINLAATPTWTGSHRFDAGVGIGSAASASAHLAFGAPSEDKAPLRFTAAGPLTTVALPGAVETDGTRLYFTNDSGVRSALSMASERAFDAVKVQDVLNVPETYTQIAHLSTPVRPAGSYLFGIALTYSFNSVNQSVFIRYSSNGGADWNEYQHEASDSTNVEPWTYGYPIVLAAPGSADVILEMRKETAANTLNVLWADIWFHRVA